MCPAPCFLSSSTNAGMSVLWPAACYRQNTKARADTHTQWLNIETRNAISFFLSFFLSFCVLTKPLNAATSHKSSVLLEVYISTLRIDTKRNSVCLDEFGVPKQPTQPISDATKRALLWQFVAPRYRYGNETNVPDWTRQRCGRPHQLPAVQKAECTTHKKQKS